MPVRLQWMTEKDFDYIWWFWGCVCDYQDGVWKDDYEGWCKRVLEK